MFDLGDLPPLLERLRAAARAEAADNAAVETMAAASALACWAEALVLEAVAGLREQRHHDQSSLADELGGWDAVADRGGPCDGDEVDRFTAVEVAAALGLSTRTARDRVGLALDVVTRQPALLEAMRAGVVGVAHARAVRDALDPIADDAVAATVVSGVLAARTEDVQRYDLSMRLGALGTPAELAAHVKRDASQAGVDAAARCEAARARRRLSSWALTDGMAALQVTGPAVTIAAAVAAVDRRAQDAVDAARAAAEGSTTGAVRGAASGIAGDADEVPTLDQARADAVLDVLTGSPDLERLPGHVGLDVTVLVPLEVLTHVAATAPTMAGMPAGPPAELPGLGPLPDLVARAVAASARRVRVAVLDQDGHVATPCSGHSPGKSAGRHSRVGRPPALQPHGPEEVKPEELRPSARNPSPNGHPAPALTPPSEGTPPCAVGPPGPATSPDLDPPRLRVDCLGVHDGADVYRPSAALERAVKARDVTCRWPGCRARAARCDLDHTVPFPEGPTTGCNLACLCRLHHRTKHRAGWLVLQGASGRLDLISPTGRVHVTEPMNWHRRRPDLGGGRTEPPI